MKTTLPGSLALLTALLGSALLSTAHAGHQIAAADKGCQYFPEPVRTWFPNDPAGLITLGAQFSEHLSGAYLDAITGVWAPESRDAFLFLNSRYHLEDNHQFIQSTGAGFRKLLTGPGIIIGGNAYWDSLHSERHNDFEQLGLGFEILSRWVDARFNYYLPEDERFEIERSSDRDSSRSVIGGNLAETNRKRSFKRFEAALEGFNTEVGFLIPGLDKYAEVRVFGGYYHYNNPFGHDFDGFKARLEARLLPGVIADVEYWEDAALMGGHWTAGARVSVPFSIYNLVTGRNPFEGIGESFTPRRREMQERLSEMVIRSHRIQTVSSGNIQTGDSRSTDVRLHPAALAPQPGAAEVLPFE